ncbi:hypothetical protein HBI37_214110 [Parastagonospora nodorum]|nr:hypothetical protein HBI37_214110 [Parastagonospora nodorum]
MSSRPNRPSSPQRQHIISTPPPLYNRILPLALLKTLNILPADLVRARIRCHGPEANDMSLIDFVLDESVTRPRSKESK